MNKPFPYTITFTADPSLRKPEVGVAPLGYRKMVTDNQAVVIPDEETAPKVVLAFELAARGSSFRKILEILTAEGLRSNRGNSLALSSLHNMLTNPFYVGDFRTARDTWHANHAPLISKTLFKRVQRTLKTKTKRLARPQKTSFASS